MIARLYRFGQLAAAIVVAKRLAGGITRQPAVVPDSMTSDAHGFSIVIPARNEGQRIGRCIESVLQFFPGAEVIVVDDESNDDTATVARSAGAHVVTGAPLPTGWVGKPWALQQGLHAAHNETIVFIDADVIVRHGFVDAIKDALQHHDLVTLAPRLATSSVIDQALSASMVTTIVYRFGAVGPAHQPRPRRLTGNGQCMVTRRQWFSERGGFERVRANMTDDIALVRSLARRGARITFLDGSHVITTRMYDSFAETWREWPRSLPMVDATAPAQRAVDAATIGLTLAAPLVALAVGRSNIVDRILIGQRVALGAALLKSYEKPKWGVLLSPLCDPMVFVRYLYVLVKPVKRWRGRTYAHLGSADR